MSKPLSLFLALFGFAFFILQFSIRLPGAFDGSFPADFPNYYFAGKRFLEGRQVYADLAGEVRNSLGWNYTSYTADTPFTVVILSPLSFLEYKAAWLLLVLVSIATIYIAITLAAAELSFPRENRLLFAALTLSAGCTIYLLMRNHMESLVLGGGVMGWLAMRRGENYRAGFWWGAASALKLFPLLWIAGAIFCNKPRIFASGTVTFLIFSLLGAALIGHADTETFLFNVIPRSQEWYGAVGNYSILSFSTAILGKSAGLWAGIIVSCILIAALTLKIRELRSIDAEHQADLFWISVCTASLLLSPLAWFNYLVLVWLSLIIIVRYADLSNTRTRIGVLLLLIIFWNWPEYTETGHYYGTVIASFVPTFALGYLFVAVRPKRSTFPLPARNTGRE